MPDIWSDFRSGVTHDRAAAWRLACLEVLRLSGLFLPSYYLACRGALPAGADPLDDYHDHGWRAGHGPNPYFDPAWYLASYPDVASAGGDPLLHYASYGEVEGRRPGEWFDPAWYLAHHAVPAGMHALAHFLCHRCDGSASPIGEFDSAWYLRTYPDVAAAGMDPAEHFRVRGFREGRRPTPAFDTRFYRHRYLPGRPDEDPLVHYRRHRDEPGVHISLPPGQTTLAREVRRFASPGPAFEPVDHTPAGPARAMVLAFYLPQFHPIDQNDAWWGTGFTEWTNVARGLPRFAGHYQPRVPRDLGHYRLDDPAVLPRQVAMAAAAGLGGFVFYYYRFGAHRLLDRPVEDFLAAPEIDFPFCLMWANENWTRRWDGAADEILIAQSYEAADEPALIADFARHFADPRYIRLHGRPLLMVYRAGSIPGGAATVARWRQLFAALAEDPILVMAQSFDDRDPTPLGMDGAVEFPPHGLVRNLAPIAHQLELLDHEFTAQVYAYDDAAAAAGAMAIPEYPLIRCAMPGWDNDARRQGRGMVMHGATPARYQQWLTTLIDQAVARPVFGAPVVCVNAWNEWAEGAYLEPDQHFGAAFLNATRRAVFGPGADPARVLLVGHDAFAAGSQLLLLHIARALVAAHGARVEIALLAGGALETEYRAVAPVHVIADDAALAAVLRQARARGCDRAVVNSAAAAGSCQALRALGFRTTLLVHEMPGLLADRGLTQTLLAAMAQVQTVVFAAEPVRQAVAPDLAHCVILPQGIYRDLRATPRQAAAVRAEWGIGELQVLAIGLGYADHRKGFDYFLEVFDRAGPDVHLAWVGDFDPAMAAAAQTKIAAAEATGRFHRTFWREDVAALLLAADVFLLTSREDPYPSAALEALCLGTKVIAFAGSGGLPPDLLRLAPMGDCASMAAMVRAASRPGVRTSLLPPGHQFGAYVRQLARLIWPEPTAEVVVTCYRQAGFLPRRLASVFAQTVPVAAIGVWDDASDDGSVAVAEAAARDAGRRVAICPAERNSGSPFGRWHEAVAAATADLVWIAEADDVAEPGLLAALAPRFADPSVVLAFCDSRPVNHNLAPREEDYRGSYAAAAGAPALTADGVYDGRDFVARFLAERNILFNVSAVVWRRTALLAALERLGAELAGWRVAGDWRLYVEVLTDPAARIAHVAQPLNLHCRDGASASARLPKAAHLREIGRMHRLLRTLLADPPGLAARQAAFARAARAYLDERI